MAKTKEKRKVIKLRKQGLSLRDIAGKVPVSRSTISKWAREIDLTSEQKKILHEKNPAYNGQSKGASAMKEKHRKKRVGWQNEGAKLVSKFNKYELFIAGCMLFWAEGSKDRNSVHFTNSDPQMLLLWLRFLKECMGVGSCNVSVYIQCHLENGLKVTEIESYWLKLLGFSKDRLRKTHIVSGHPRSKKTRPNKLMYGVCRLTVGSTEIAQKIFGAISKIGDLPTPLCLD